jgi:hypothetical protein
MTLIIGVAALAIDVGSWLVTRHHAQVAADAAALAGANCMAAGGSVATCSSGNTAPSTVVSDNGFSSPPDVEFNQPASGDITVAVSGSGSTTFASAVGIKSPSISARAVASWQQQDCTAAGSSCAFIYAGDNICSGTTGVTDTINGGTVNHGISISKSGTGNSPGIKGDVISASDITTNTNGNPTFGAAVFSNGTGCQSLPTSPPPPTPTSPSPYSAMYQRAVSTQLPIDYRLIYSACGTVSTKFGNVKCINGYPSYCTLADEGISSITTLDSNAVYCNAGTSTTPGDPSTWNGTTSYSGSGNATFIAGEVDLTIGNSSLAPAANNQLLAYAAECNASSPTPSTCSSAGTATTKPAVTLTYGGNGTVSGDIFAPAGVIDTGGAGTPTVTGFLEGWDVVYNAKGTAVGQGPAVTSTATFIGDTLIQ